MSHSFHESLLGYDQRQLFHDDCAECEYRGRNPGLALHFIDQTRLRHAWRRAFLLFAAGRMDEVGYRARAAANELGPIAHSERPILEILWYLQVEFAKDGLPLGAYPPDGQFLVQ